MKPKLEKLFVEYDSYHLNPTNRLTHKVAIPLILFNALAMFDWVALGPIPGSPGWSLTLAHLFLVAACAWYLAMSIKLGAIMTAALIAILALGWGASVNLVLTAGAAGWLIQFAGHYIWEKKAPNFMTNAIQLLVGPVYFVALLTGDWKLPAPSAETRQDSA